MTDDNDKHTEIYSNGGFLKKEKVNEHVIRVINDAVRALTESLRDGKLENWPKEKFDTGYRRRMDGYMAAADIFVRGRWPCNEHADYLFDCKKYLCSVDIQFKNYDLDVAIMATVDYDPDTDPKI